MKTPTLFATTLLASAALSGAVRAQNAVGATSLEAYPTYHCVGVDVAYNGDDNANLQAEMHYRLAGEPFWREGVEMTFDREKKHIWASVFRFNPGQKMEVRVTLTDPDVPTKRQLAQIVTLRTPKFSTSGGQTFYVSDQAKNGGNGSKNRPFSTIKSATTNLQPGDTVVIQPGTYHETIALHQVQGTPEKPIVIRGAVSNIKATSLPTTGQVKGAYKPQLPLLTSKKSLPKGVWKRVEGDLWATPVSDLYLDARNNVGYLARDDMRMFWYQDLSTLKAMPVDSAPENKRSYRVEMEMTEKFKGNKFEGLPAWTYDARAKMLYAMMEPGDTPNRSTFDYATMGRGVDLRDCKNVVVRDLEFSHFGNAAISMTGDTDNCSIYNNLIHHSWVGLDLLSYQADNNTLWNNQLYDRGLYLYSWRAYMTPLTKRNHAQGFEIESGRGTSIVGNFVRGYNNAFVPQVYRAPDLLGVNRDLDMIDNLAANAGDDSYEPDGGGVNLRMLNNVHSNTLEGVSVAPIERGPVYVVGNYGVSRNYYLKLMNNHHAPGALFLYHNTGLVIDGRGLRMPNVIEDGETLIFEQKHVLNNIFATSRDFVSWGHPNAELDYNCYWHIPNSDSNRKYTPFTFNREQRYDSLAGFREGTGKERNGLIGDPRFASAGITQADIMRAFVDETVLPFNPRLMKGSACIDRAAVIRGINQNFVGAGPDIGAFENNRLRDFGGAVVR